MTAKIDTPLGEATITDYQWTSDNEVLAEFLNGMLSQYGPSGGDPNPDDTAARRAIETLPGSTLLESEETEYDENVIY